MACHDGRGPEENMKNLALKKVGNNWLLEYKGNLKRLAFLNKAKDVSIDDDIIFADDNLFQITITETENVEVMKIEDVFYKAVALDLGRKSGLENERVDLGHKLGLEDEIVDFGRKPGLEDESVDLEHKPGLEDESVGLVRKPDLKDESVGLSRKLGLEEERVGLRRKSGMEDGSVNEQKDSDEYVNMHHDIAIPKAVHDIKGIESDSSEVDANSEVENHQKYYENLLGLGQTRRAVDNDPAGNYERLQKKRQTDYESLIGVAATDILVQRHSPDKRNSKFQVMLKWLSSFVWKKKPSKPTERVKGETTTKSPVRPQFQIKQNKAKSQVPSEINSRVQKQTQREERLKFDRKETTQTDVVRVVALFAFEALHDDDISFDKGDKLAVKKEAYRQSTEWCTGKNLTTWQEGYIPRTYITEDDNSVHTQDWWYNINSPETHRLLSSACFPVGTFLVRGDHSFMLSIKCSQNGVIHYKIQRSDNGKVFLNLRRMFDHVSDLIAYHKVSADGIRCKLKDHYPKKRPFVHLRELEVNKDTVEVLKRFQGDNGHYGDIYTGKFRKNLDVAVKLLKRDLIKMPSQKLLAGMKVIHQLRHKSLVQLLAISTQTEPVWMVFELVNKGSLLDYLRQEDTVASLLFGTLTDISAQIAYGMAYLEDNNFIHGDLRAANVLMADHEVVKVADHGLLQLLEEDIINKPEIQLSGRLPLKWFAPEVLVHGRFSTKSDVWSYGVLLHEIISGGCIPYPGMSGKEVYNRVVEGYRMPKPTSGPFGCPDPYYEIMLKCWNEIPDCRPTFSYLHHFFEDYKVSTEPLKVKVS